MAWAEKVLQFARLRCSGITARAMATANRYSVWICVAFCLLMLGRGLATAVARPLWYDEVFTAVFARLEHPASIVHAVRTAADPLPPAYYVLEGAVARWISSEPLGLRLPSAIAVASAVAFVFAFLRLSVDPVSALLGAGFLFVTAAVPYAAEARPYGILLGCTAGAALAWALAHRSRGALAALGGFLAAGTALHYYAIFVVFAFLAAEIWLSLDERRIRARLCLPLLAGMTPFFIQWPFLERARQVFGSNFWKNANIDDPAYAFRDLFPYLWMTLPVAGILAASAVFPRWREAAGGKSIEVRSAHSEGLFSPCCRAPLAVAISLMLVLPLTAAGVAWMLKGGFTPRYVLPMVAGASMVFGICCSRMSAGQKVFILLLLLGLGTYQCGSSVWRAAKEQRAGRSARTQTPFQRLMADAERGPGPLVISSGKEFLEEFGRRTGGKPAGKLFVADPRLAVKISGTDSVDLGLLGLRKVVELNVIEYEQFKRQYNRFSVLAGQDGMEWLVPQLTEDGCRLNLIGKDGPFMLFRSECGWRER